MFRPRGSEVKAVVDLLESGDYETSEDLAKTIIQTLVGELAKRDAYGIARGLRTDDLRIPHGPYWDKRDAERAVKASREAGLVAFMAPLSSPVLPEPQRSSLARCEGCAHAVQFHDSRGCWTFTKDRTRCECRLTP